MRANCLLDGDHVVSSVFVGGFVRRSILKRFCQADWNSPTHNHLLVASAALDADATDTNWWWMGNHSRGYAAALGNSWLASIRLLFSMIDTQIPPLNLYSSLMESVRGFEHSLSLLHSVSLCRSWVRKIISGKWPHLTNSFLWIEFPLGYGVWTKRLELRRAGKQIWHLVLM